jgi:NAD(P)-dependent dehydrogenase (short-subunit alcohol dehydrogenase family)
MNFNFDHLFNVKEKRALITGGGTGIGKMLTYALATNGAVVYIASRKMEVIQATALEINTAIGAERVIPIQADLLTKKDCDHLAEEISKREPKLHILINNAGMSWGNPYDQFSEKNGWDKLFALNVKSIYYLTVALTPLLELGAQGNEDPSRVINISSVAAQTPRAETPLSRDGAGTWSYNASKAAVNQLTQSLALTLAPKFITCNAIAPGFFPSRMTKFGVQENLEVLESIQPLGRIGKAEDMAALGVFLCSRGSAHLTGIIIPIDGGQSLARL